MKKHIKYPKYKTKYSSSEAMNLILKIIAKYNKVAISSGTNIKVIESLINYANLALIKVVALSKFITNNKTIMVVDESIELLKESIEVYTELLNLNS